MLSHPMKRFRRALLIASLFAATTGSLAACGQEGISVASDESSAAADLQGELLRLPHAQRGGYAGLHDEHPDA